MLLIYQLAIRVYFIGITLASLFNGKARKWVMGRRGLFRSLQAAMKDIRPQEQKLIWIHCASLGEFEQGRPIIETLKKKEPELKILLTFFSASGYEIRKNYAFADHVAYLPADTPKNAQRFVEITRPAVAIFVKYEFWYYHLSALHKAGIPSLLISASFRPGQVFFRWYGGLFRKLLRQFDHIFVQNEKSADLLRQLTEVEYSIAGDTRVDRVAEIAAAPPSYPVAEAFAADSKVLIAGSTWPADEELLRWLIHRELPEDWKVIMAPHQIDPEKIGKLQDQLLLPSIRYSAAGKDTEYSRFRILIIDNIGMLSTIYQYGSLAYIGGGFGSGIHNTLEPMAFGLPVIFGPRHHKFEEAVTLVEQGGAFSVRNHHELASVFHFLRTENKYRKASAKTKQYIARRSGGTQKIINYLERYQEKN